MSKKPRPNSTLIALSSAAMALPALSLSLKAAEQVEQASLSYRFTDYGEGDVAREDSPGGERQRYDIDIHQLQLQMPVGDRFQITLDYAIDKMSGASAWFIIPGQNNKPLQVLTGATIQDIRRDVSVKGSAFLGDIDLSVTAGISDEDDYLARTLSFEGSWHFNQKMTTLSGGYGLSRDRINPTDSELFPLRVVSEHRRSDTLFAGLSQVIDKNTVLQSTVSLTRKSGFLADPYKQTFVAGNLLADSRPDSRNELAWLTRMRHYVDSLNGALHVDYRFYFDDWAIRSNTLDIAWYQNLPMGWTLTPAIRYYSQTEANFYANFFLETRPEETYSSDYRLSPYGAFSLLFKAVKDFDRWALTVSFERYISAGKYSLYDVEQANPGLIDFTLVTVGFDVKF